MSATFPNDGVVRSVRGWLQRLGWSHLASDQLAPLRDPHDSHLLMKRLLPWLRRYRFQWAGERVPLAPDSLALIVDHVEACCHLLDWRSASNAVHRLLQEGVPSEQSLPDGTLTTVMVQLLDWEHVGRNHWDVAEVVHGLPFCGAADVRELVGFVNGLPLVVLACVERDRQGRWGTTADGIEHLWRGMRSGSVAPPPPQAQLLLSLDRRGGRYATVGTSRHAWVRWREHGWNPTLQAQLRAATVPFADGPLHPPRSAHAELLFGLLAPARLLQLLRGFMRVGTGGVRHVARSAQFFAVQQALQALRTVDADGRRSGGQLCLAAGSGLQLTRHWLLRAVAADPSLRGLRVLLPVTRSMPAAPDRRRRRRDPLPGSRLDGFLAGAGPASLELTLSALRGWARRTLEPQPSDDLVLLVDGDLWESDPVALRRVRRCLPGATWLTLVAQPVTAPAADLDPGPLLFQYPPQQAVEDGVVAPVWTDRSIAVGNGRRDAGAREPCRAAAIGQHFHRVIRLAERDLRAMLLAADAQQAQNYQRAFASEGNLRVQVIAFDPNGLPEDRACSAPPPEVELLITYGTLPAVRDPRLALLYVDRALTGVERLRAISLTTSLHPDKQASLLIELHDGPAHGTGSAPEGPLSAWLPLPVAADPHDLSARYKRLRALMPDGMGDDFHACRDHLAPNWALNRHGGDVDLHRRRRDLLHVRVTAFGQRLQVVTSSNAAFRGAQSAALGTQYRRELHRYSLLRDAASHEARELGRYVAEDVRVRHWAREQAPQLRELAADYQVLRAIEPPEVPAAQRANQLYTQLRLRLDDAGEEPRFVDEGRRSLCQVLADHADPHARLQALTVLETALQRSPLDPGNAPPRSRGTLLLEGVLDGALAPPLCDSMGSRIDALVAAARTVLPGLPQVFREEVREELQRVFGSCLDDAQLQAVVDAVLARAPYWPATD
ncbi:type I restriction endonuclease [Stenotrophomonas sp.]|uniref:type I restriction endonuclease n=1 Tax=Stenotrophomonas sp. TaxID=69392 RepID=UPI0028B0B5B2|nr:type I restriction endonuclease [Stenotrophomonas sp.]